MHLGERVVQRLAVAQRLVDRRVESVKNAQLELIRALEEIFKVGEREDHIRDACAWCRWQTLARRVVGRAALDILRSENVVPELRTVLEELVPRNGRPGQMQELLAPGHRHVEEPPLVLDGALEPRLPLDAVARQQVPHAAAARSFRREAVLEQRGHEHDRPLHALGLVDGHDPDGVRVGVLVVLPAFGVGVLGAVLQEIGERCIFLHRLRVVVDRLEVGDELAEFAEIVEDDLAAAMSGHSSSRTPASSRKVRNTRWIE